MFQHVHFLPTSSLYNCFYNSKMYLKPPLKTPIAIKINKKRQDENICVWLLACVYWGCVYPIYVFLCIYGQDFKVECMVEWFFFLQINIPYKSTTSFFKWSNGHGY
jgi:hypothetical protein